MPRIRKWRCKVFVIKLQRVLKSIMICMFCLKILTIVQNNSLSFKKIVKLYFSHFPLIKIIVQIIKLKIQHYFLATNFCHFFLRQIK